MPPRQGRASFLISTMAIKSKPSRRKKQISKRSRKPVKIKASSKAPGKRACPCPIHKGKKLPLTSEYWHKAGSEGFQRMCKLWRRQKAKERAAAIYAANPKAERERMRKQYDKQHSGRYGGGNRKSKWAGVKSRRRCTRCKIRKTLNETFWRKDNTKGVDGYKQPCKDCIAKQEKKTRKKITRSKTHLDTEKATD